MCLESCTSELPSITTDHHTDYIGRQPGDAREIDHDRREEQHGDRRGGVRDRLHRRAGETERPLRQIRPRARGRGRADVHLSTQQIENRASVSIGVSAHLSLLLAPSSGCNLLQPLQAYAGSITTAAVPVGQTGGYRNLARRNAYASLASCSSLSNSRRQIRVAAARLGRKLPNASTVSQPS